MSWKIPIVVLSLALLCGYGINRLLTPNLSTEPPEIVDGWWGRGVPEVSGREPDTSVRPFRVNVSDGVLADLTSRLKNTRFVDRLEDSAFNYGFNSEYMKQVQRYWLEKYSWRDAERRLNQFDHFLTNIEGIDVHFIRVKPKLQAGQKTKPLIMVHGWPGSIYEFHKILPMLTDPLNHGGTADDMFDVICPSIPGYGFSEAPHKQGFSASEAARIFHKLMRRLGFEKYYVQGGDWGGMITLNMAIMFPDYVKGVHTNGPMQWSLKGELYPWLAHLWPSVFMPSEEDQARFLPPGDLWVYLLQESGYFHIQATKPDTAGQGVNDSPVGLAAYIMEKLSTWTNREWRNLPDGGLTKVYTLDDLLTNVMIYWVNGNIASSMRLYKEEMGGNSRYYVYKHKNMVPYGYADFPEEILHGAEWALREVSPNLVSYTIMPRGGHFAAFQEPQLLADDVRQFVRKVEAL